MRVWGTTGTSRIPVSLEYIFFSLMYMWVLHVWSRENNIPLEMLSFFSTITKDGKEINNLVEL